MTGGGETEPNARLRPESATARREAWERRAAEEMAALAADPADRAELDLVDALFRDDDALPLT